jgi:hypothetical protein
MIDYELLIALNKQHIRELHEDVARLRLAAGVRRRIRCRREKTDIDSPTSLEVVDCRLLPPSDVHGDR